MNRNSILSMRNISKSFGGVHALSEVDLEVEKGEVHALIGENGAGKSTLMKILSGALKTDTGTMELKGESYAPTDPLHARRTGISMVYQELNLALHLTVEENLMLGIEQSSFGIIDAAKYRERIREALSTLEHPGLQQKAKVMDLPPAARQLVEIARGLITDTDIFVLDEPTSSLSRVDAEHLFEVIRGLSDKGVSIIYISHFLEEVQQVADRFTVLRDGRTVGTGSAADTSTDEIIEMMVGRSLRDMFPRVPHDIAGEVFRVEHIGSGKVPEDVSFSVRAGEIFGIAGLVGAGRSETLRAIFGLKPMRKGQIHAFERFTFRGGQTPYTMIRRGIAFLSEDRKNEGLSLRQSVAENITLSTLYRYHRHFFVANATIEQVAADWVHRLAIKVGKVVDRADSLSGGNQQKIVLARLLQEDADVFLFDEPTRGVDVGSKVEIFRLIGDLAAEGKAVVIVSSYLPELLGVCDTIAVMHRGVLGPKRDRDDWDEYSIMNEATAGAEYVQ